MCSCPNEMIVPPILIYDELTDVLSVYVCSYRIIPQ